MSTEALEAMLVRFAEEVWQQGNLTVVEEFFADDYVFHDPVNPLRGPEAFKQYAAEVHLAFPNLQFTIDDVIVDGNRAVARWRFRGTYKG